MGDFFCAYLYFQSLFQRLYINFVIDKNRMEHIKKPAEYYYFLTNKSHTDYLILHSIDSKVPGIIQSPSFYHILLEPLQWMPNWSCHSTA